MSFRLNRQLAYFFFAAFLFLGGGFVAGFVSRGHLRAAPADDLLHQQLALPGDATPSVRAGVVAALSAFQSGYDIRDPQKLDSFMTSLFPKDGDVLILGTEGGTEEWVRGKSAAAGFIAADWRQWGELRFDVNNAVVWSSENVAWVATVGAVRFTSGNRPLRFTAILTKEDDRWVFRQLQFQWNDSAPDESDLVHPRSILHLVRLALDQKTP